jgi:hypothetical protein
LSPQDVAATVKKMLGGEPGMMRVADDSGDWLVVNRQACSFCLPQNVPASIMASKAIFGDCLVFRAARPPA